MSVVEVCRVRALVLELGIELEHLVADQGAQLDGQASQGRCYALYLARVCVSVSCVALSLSRARGRTSGGMGGWCVVVDQAVQL